MVNLAVLEPEITSALIPTGAGPPPPLPAATHFHKATGEIILSGIGWHAQSLRWVVPNGQVG